MSGKACYLLFLRLIVIVVQSGSLDVDGKTLSDASEESFFENILNINEGIKQTLKEGDIKMEADYELKQRERYPEKRNARRDRHYLWHDKIVSYEITPELETHRYVIEDAMTTLSNQSCIAFKNHTTEKNWIKIVKRDGCWSSVGRSFWRSGSQEISLGVGCYKKGIIMHELLHALGFWHEQSRPDRHKYVAIFWENIIPGNENNFEQRNSATLDVQQVTYDYHSIMHYDSNAFSKNGKKTIIPFTNITIGGRLALSPKDVIELNLLYDCKSGTVNVWSSWSDVGPCNEHCKKSKQRYCTHHNKCPGANSYGVETSTTKCGQAECYAPIDGHWGRWSGWTDCTVSCGKGTKSRQRKCDNPDPNYGGKKCIGDVMSVSGCVKRLCSLGPNDCQFTFNLCGVWKDSSTNAFKWIRNKGTTPSSETGPEKDHTGNNGYYIYAEASFVPKGSIAVLESKEFTPTPSRCISFWYHMYGMAMGDLSVRVRESIKLGYKESTLIFVHGEQGKAWKQIKVTYASVFRNKIIFEAIMGPGYHSDIALDDIYIKDSNCDSGPPTTQASTTSVTTQASTTSVTTQASTTSVTTQASTTSVTTQASTTPVTQTTTSENNFETIGCYNDKNDNRKPFPQNVNMRKYINWHDITKIVQRCAKYVRSLGFEYFGLQFYGECWYGPTEKVHYDIDGPSLQCWMQQVGRQNAIMVYKLK